jgi:DEAD/DEAH box helicase domain-containing protein
MKATTVDGEIAGGPAEVIATYRGWGKARWSAVIPGRDAELVPVPDGLPEPLLAALASMDRTRLYSHQRRTIELVRDGRDVLLVTSTASGKTLAFNAAILDRLLREPHSRALYLYPLNALANDQRQGLENLVSLLPAGTRPRVGLVTGQASAEEKRAARDAHLILTNPETVHFSILQRPEQWRAALGQLRFLVVDEAHMYRGAFGAHAAHVLRRLLRLARAAGADPQVIAASATIGNPVELGKLEMSRS